MKNELGLTRKALMANPKSYSAWFQRFWVLEREISPDLKQELELCKTALAVDCRNFHCWDHRRLVVKLAEISAEDELEFSNALIQSNPSNYSAWHYRGMLLMKTQPDLSGHGMVISEDCLASEFEVGFSFIQNNQMTYRGLKLLYGDIIFLENFTNLFIQCRGSNFVDLLSLAFRISLSYRSMQLTSCERSVEKFSTIL